MIQGKCYRCSTSGEVTVCEECGQVFCSRCYPMHTPCAIQLQTAEVADYDTKKMELVWKISKLHDELVVNVEAREEMSADDSRCFDNQITMSAIIHTLVVGIKELKLLEHTPDVKQDLTSYMAQQQRVDEVDALGDKGQRYVIRCLGPEGKVRTVGYVTNSNLVTTMVLAVMLHPSFHSPSVIDREAPVVPKPPLHTSDLWCAGYELALRSYAYWKDGIQYVGSTGKTLKEALIDMRKE